MIEKVIRELADGWGCSPYEINNGECEDFMMEVCAKVEGASDLATECFVEFGELPGHVWILFNNRHYDAECPEGVDDWRDLPLFDKLKTNPHYAPVFEQYKPLLDEKGWVLNPRKV